MSVGNRHTWPDWSICSSIALSTDVRIEPACSLEVRLVRFVTLLLWFDGSVWRFIVGRRVGRCHFIARRRVVECIHLVDIPQGTWSIGQKGCTGRSAG
jgi:hypothetical protein